MTRSQELEHYFLAEHLMRRMLPALKAMIHVVKCYVTNETYDLTYSGCRWLLVLGGGRLSFWASFCRYFQLELLLRLALLHLSF